MPTAYNGEGIANAPVPNPTPIANHRQKEMKLVSLSQHISRARRYLKYAAGDAAIGDYASAARALAWAILGVSSRRVNGRMTSPGGGAVAGLCGEYVIADQGYVAQGLRRYICGGFHRLTIIMAVPGSGWMPRLCRVCWRKTALTCCQAQ